MRRTRNVLFGILFVGFSLAAGHHARASDYYWPNCDADYHGFVGCPYGFFVTVTNCDSSVTCSAHESLCDSYCTANGWDSGYSGAFCEYDGDPEVSCVCAQVC